MSETMALLYARVFRVVQVKVYPKSKWDYALHTTQSRFP